MQQHAEFTESTQFVVPVLAKLIRHNAYRTGTEFEFYVNATHAAEWKFDGKNRRAFIDDLAKREGKLLPVGDPDWDITRAPLNSVSHLIGEAMKVRCTWPREQELAL